MPESLNPTGSAVTELASRGLPPQGLIPQLIDVLHAFAESHALLLRKVQSVRLQPMETVSPLVDDAELASIRWPKGGPGQETKAEPGESAESDQAAAVLRRNADIAIDQPPFNSEPTPQVHLGPAESPPGDAKPANRNYNFFDDLDAQLAGLNGAVPPDPDPS